MRKDSHSLNPKRENIMGMSKKEFTEHKMAVEETEMGIAHLMKWGKLSFKDFTGEWVEVRTSGQLNLFSDDIDPIPHPAG